MDTRWSLGVLIGLPATILSIAMGVAPIWLGFHLLHKEEPSGYSSSLRGEGLVSLWSGIVWTIVTVVFAGFCFFPFSAEYHQWRPTAGTVKDISSRILGDGTAVSQRFVVTFTDGRQRSCDDTRCALIHKGDYLALSCKRAYQWSGTPGYDCNFVEYRRN